MKYQGDFLERLLDGDPKAWEELSIINRELFDNPYKDYAEFNDSAWDG